MSLRRNYFDSRDAFAFKIQRKARPPCIGQQVRNTQIYWLVDSGDKVVTIFKEGMVMACINILQQGSLQPRNQRWSKTANTVSHWKRAKGLFFFFFSTRIRMEVLVYRDYGEQEACSATSLPFRFLQRLIFLLSVELLVCNCM